MITTTPIQNRCQDTAAAVFQILFRDAEADILPMLADDGDDTTAG